MIKATSSTSSFFNLNLTTAAPSATATTNNGSSMNSGTGSSSATSKNSSCNSTGGINSNMDIIHVETQIPLQVNPENGLSIQLINNGANSGRYY